MKNKLIDLNNALFAELERLSDEDIKGENLREEIDRADAISKISTQIIANGKLAVRAEEFKQYYGVESMSLPIFKES